AEPGVEGLTGLVDAPAAGIEQINAVERAELGPADAAADREPRRRQLFTDQRERERVAVRLGPGARVRHSRREGSGESESRIEASDGIVQGRRVGMAGVDLLQREREAAVPGPGRRENPERQRAPRSGIVRHAAERGGAEEARGGRVLRLRDSATALSAQGSGYAEP